MTKRMMVTVGDRVRSLREKLGITQFELASRAGVRPDTVSRLERGRGSGSLVSLCKIVPILGTTIDYLAYGKEPPAAKKRKPSGDSDGRQQEKGKNA